MGKKVDKVLILNEIKSYLGFKKDVDFANFLGIPTSTLGSWRERNTFDIDLLFAKCEGINANWLITGKGDMFKRPAVDVLEEPKPHYGSLPLIPIEAAAGYGKGDLSDLKITESYVVPEFEKKADYLIRVTGTSMSPKYYNGDVLACKNIPTKTFIQWGKVYVMDTVQGALCKRLYPGSKPGLVKAVSENQAYEPFEISFKTDVRSLAIVVGVIRLE